MTDTDHAPTRLPDRIDTLDVLRGVAICGILLMNIPMMGMVGLGGRPTTPFAWTADWTAWTAQSILFEGTMRGLFTLLFGAGMVLMLRRAEGPDPQVTPVDIWTRRCLLLMGLGIVQWAVLFWPGEILWTYGLVGLALLAFRTARPRTLLLAAAILLVGVTAVRIESAASHLAEGGKAVAALQVKASGRLLTEEQDKALMTREETRAMLGLDPKAAAEERAARTTLPGVFVWSRDLWVPWNLGTDAWAWLAETLCFMLIGMALYRTGILTGQAAPRTYRLMMLGGYGGGLAIRLAGWAAGLRTGQLVDPDRLDAVAMMWHSVPYDLGRLLITLGHVGLIVALFRSGALGAARPLRALGRMALTVYMLQSILTSALFYGFGMLGAFGFAALMGIAVMIWIATGLFAVAWLRGHEMGPAEQLLRAMTYGTFRRRRPAAAAELQAAPSV